MANETNPQPTSQSTPDPAVAASAAGPATPDTPTGAAPASATSAPPTPEKVTDTSSAAVGAETGDVADLHGDTPTAAPAGAPTAEAGTEPVHPPAPGHDTSSSSTDGGDTVATDTGPVPAGDVTDESGPDLPVLPVGRVSDQFPAVDGTREGAEREVRQRTVDAEPGEDIGTRFVKVFRVGRHTPPENDPCHVANAIQVVQEAMQRGLHARGDVYLTGATEVDEPLNPSGTRRRLHTDLRYEVDVVPASADATPAATTSPTVIHQAHGDVRSTGSTAADPAGGDGGDRSGSDDVGDRG